MDGWIDTWMNGRINGWMDRCIGTCRYWING